MSDNHAETSFLKQNARYLLGLVFAAGILYGEFKHVRTLESRLSKKIKVVQELEKEVNLLKIKTAVLEQQIKNCNE